ncbi:hypothetical protein [Maribacter hydrothermalis]|uniref:Uncharacterized protein n=1 Tax=Maribacter hydrothermalis TaxID=1836467 RepID=A0A1B7ZBY3_9FLAO|nr:hypothetical protein [Maribacter hydrothermalis]OBR40416.1 hypothetical protein A9200_16190 [Maribacter hydrothermalis]
MHKLFLFIKSLLIPFKVDAILPNILIFIPRVFAGYLLSFVYAINKFGTPWTPKALGLQLFEVSEWFIEIVKQFGLPFSLMPQVFGVYRSYRGNSINLRFKYKNNLFLYTSNNVYYNSF